MDVDQLKEIYNKQVEIYADELIPLLNLISSPDGSQGEKFRRYMLEIKSDFFTKDDDFKRMASEALANIPNIGIDVIGNILYVITKAHNNYPEYYDKDLQLMEFLASKGYITEEQVKDFKKIKG